MMMKRFRLLSLALAASAIACGAQNVSHTTSTPAAESRHAVSGEVPCRPLRLLGKPGIFNQLEVGGVIGTTGLGLEVAAPVTEWVKVRAGVDWIPPVRVPMHFNIQAYKTGAVNSGNFGKVQHLMSELGFDMDQIVDVDGTPHVTTFKFLVDVYPLKNNRHWRVTAGFYAGGRRVGKAVNTLDEAPSLVCMKLYNNFYDYVMNTDFIETPIYNDIYLDPEVADQLKERLEDYGRLGVHMGDFRNGDPYMLEPGRDGQVKANAYVNAVRPYIGLGYDGAMSADKRWRIGVDVGAQFWGGSPSVITHEGIDMTNDLVNVPGKVGTYLSIIKAIKVYPTVAVKFSYTFF